MNYITLRSVGFSILFFICSFLFAIVLIILWIIVISGITFPGGKWQDMLLGGIPVLLAYCIAGAVLRSYTRNWGFLVYVGFSIMCGLIYYFFSWETQYLVPVNSEYLFVQNLQYLFPSFGILIGVLIFQISVVYKGSTKLTIFLTGSIVLLATVFFVFRKPEIQNFDIELSKEGDNADKYTGLCEQEFYKRELLADVLLENNISHMIEESDFGHCIYWTANDSSKVMGLDELDEDYKRILETK